MFTASKLLSRDLPQWCPEGPPSSSRFLPVLDWASADSCFSSKKGWVILRPWPASNRCSGSPGFLEDPWLTKQLLHPLQQTGLLFRAPALLSLTNKARHLKPGRAVWTPDSLTSHVQDHQVGVRGRLDMGLWQSAPCPSPTPASLGLVCEGCLQSFVTKIKYWHLQTAYLIINLVGESE